MDAIPCETCGYDTHDHHQHVNELKLENKRLKEQSKAFEEANTEFKIQIAKNLGGDTALGLKLIRHVSMVFMCGFLCVTSCEIGPSLASVMSQTQTTQVMSASQASFEKCISSAAGDLEREICFFMIADVNKQAASLLTQEEKKNE